MVAKVALPTSLFQKKTGVGHVTLHFTFSTLDSTGATVVHRVELFHPGLCRRVTRLRDAPLPKPSSTVTAEKQIGPTVPSEASATPPGQNISISISISPGGCARAVFAEGLFSLSDLPDVPPNDFPPPPPE